MNALDWHPILVSDESVKFVQSRLYEKLEIASVEYLTEKEIDEVFDVRKNDPSKQSLAAGMGRGEKLVVTAFTATGNQPPSPEAFQAEYQARRRTRYHEG